LWSESALPSNKTENLEEVQRSFGKETVYSILLIIDKFKGNGQLRRQEEFDVRPVEVHQRQPSTRRGEPLAREGEPEPSCLCFRAGQKLQDGSGGFQNFGGTLSRDGTSVQFKQTDAGGPQRGIMRKTSDTCSAADLRTKYYFTVSGSTTPMQPIDVPHVVSAKGTLDIAENGSFRGESDCSVRFGLTIGTQDGQVVEPSLMTMRGFLVGGAQEILAFHTDPANGGRALHIQCKVKALNGKRSILRTKCNASNGKCIFCFAGSHGNVIAWPESVNSVCAGVGQLQHSQTTDHFLREVPR
jgi:hypothetical protein